MTLGGVDALVFTAGVGEHAGEIREKEAKNGKIRTIALPSLAVEELRRVGFNDDGAIRARVPNGPANSRRGRQRPYDVRKLSVDQVDHSIRAADANQRPRLVDAPVGAALRLRACIW